jgi:hypothetical protein
MDVIKENTIKFIDALMVDNYKTAHQFLEVIVNEKMKQRISEAAKKKNPFGDDKTEKTSKSKKGVKSPKKGKNGKKVPNFIQAAIDNKNAKKAKGTK